VAQWQKSDVVGAMSAVCTVAVFMFGIWQYQGSENWKRSEFVAAQIKDFNSDKINQSVLLMMDYDPARVELFPDREKAEDRYVNIDFATLVRSIDKEVGVGDKEYQVRLYFEHFLTSMSRFNYFLASGAIEPKELCADFGYPVDLMTGAARDMKLRNTGVDIAPFSNAVSGYLKRWQNTDIADFMRRIQKACRP
jgi:hypothetical protein